MARKTRYTDYYRGMLKIGKKENRSTPKSILDRLKKMKNQEFIMNVPVGVADEQ